MNSKLSFPNSLKVILKYLSDKLRIKFNKVITFRIVLTSGLAETLLKISSEVTFIIATNKYHKYIDVMSSSRTDSRLIP